MLCIIHENNEDWRYPLTIYPSQQVFPIFDIGRQIYVEFAIDHGNTL